MSYKRVSGIPWQIVDENAIIIDPKSNKIHELNHVGTTVWSHLNGENNLEQIEEIVSETYLAQDVIVKSDLKDFCNQLKEEGLIEVIDDI